MPDETWNVIEANQQYRFARLQREGSEDRCHCELYPDEPGSEPALQLQVGDRVAGLRRGESLHRVRWVSRVPPPAAEVARMVALLARLSAAGLHLDLSPEALAERTWRKAKGSDPLMSALRLQLPFFFDWDRTHPFEDAGLLDRFTRAVERVLPGFVVQPIRGRPALRVQPGDAEVAAQGSTPERLFAPLVAHVNAELERTGAAARWMPIRRNWVLARPEVVRALTDAGVLEAEVLD